MSANTRPNGSPLAASTLTAPANRLSGTAPQLPSFVSRRSTDVHRPRHRPAPAAAPHAGLRAVGNLTLTLLVALACAMAGVAMHYEAREQQQWEQVR